MPKICNKCKGRGGFHSKGSGWYQFDVCLQCHGFGLVPGEQTEPLPCRSCGGVGTSPGCPDIECGGCKGSGERRPIGCKDCKNGWTYEATASQYTQTIHASACAVCNTGIQCPTCKGMGEGTTTLFGGYYVPADCHACNGRGWLPLNPNPWGAP